MKVHGTPPRGERDVLRSSLHEVRFGRMFRRLTPAPAYPPEDLASLAESMREQVSAGWNAEPRVEDGDNPLIPAGYTYFGQFVDHDITFDPASSRQCCSGDGGRNGAAMSNSRRLYRFTPGGSGIECSRVGGRPTC